MFASRDIGKYYSERVFLWNVHPVRESDGNWACAGGEKSAAIVAVSYEFFHSIGIRIRPGQCVEIEDIVLKRKAKPKRNPNACKDSSLEAWGASLVRKPRKAVRR